MDKYADQSSSIMQTGQNIKPIQVNLTERAINRLDEGIEILNKNISDLVSKLRPVIQPKPVDPDGKLGGELESGFLPDRIENRANKLFRVNKILKELKESIAL